MSFNRKASFALIALSLAALATPAQASETFVFPSANGVGIAATTTQFVPPADAPSLDGAVTVTGALKGEQIPLPIGSPDYKSRYGVQPYAGDPYAYRFFTHALASQSFANYAADYYRLFTPGYAVQAWTDRVAGFVDAGYGGAIDSWTGGAYYLARLRGPSKRRDSPPDLSPMPEFRPHPELESAPTFGKGS